MNKNKSTIDNNIMRDKDVIGEETLSSEKRSTAIVRRFTQNKLAVLGLVIILVIFLMSIAAPLLTPFDPVLDMELKNKLLPVGSEGHLLGTDDYGRDIFARLLYGGRVSILTGLVVSLITAVIGVSVGCIGGYYGGIVDSILMRIVDVFLSFPFLILAITIMAVLGPSQRNIIIALSISSWPGFARITRGQVLSIKENEYVEAAKASGFSNSRILISHILPNIMAPIIVVATLGVGSTILSAASLNFLGLGVDASLPEWGVMLNQGKNYLKTASHLSMFPGIAISLTVLSMNWLGDGLRDALDPHMRK